MMPECPVGDASCIPNQTGMGGASGGDGPTSMGGMPDMPVDMSQGGAAGEGGSPAEQGPICGNAKLEADERCDDGNTLPGDGCGATCRAESGWLCDSGEPTKCSSICGDGVVVGPEAQAGGCDDHNTVATDGCSAACKVEASYACSGEPSVCAKTCGDGKLDEGEACDDKNTVKGDGCTACAVEAGFKCDNSAPPSKCADIDECTTNTDNCSNLAACKNTTGSFTCTCPGGYSTTDGGVTCNDKDECKLNTDNCAANATCSNKPGSFSCTCNDGYWGNGATCSPNPSITSFTADYGRTCSGSTVTFSATFKNGTGSIDHGVGSIVSGNTAVSGAIAAQTTFKLTVSAAGGTPAVATLTIDTIAKGFFALTKKDSGAVGGPFAHVGSVKLKDGRVLLFVSSNATGEGSAQIFDPHDESFTSTTLTAGTYPTLAGLSDGRVLVTVGDGSKTANVYNPTSNAQVATGGDLLQTLLLAPGVSLANGRVLVPGGLLYNEGTGAFSALKTSEIYDPSAVANGKFIAGPDMHFARYNGGVALLPVSHKVLMASGCTTTADDGSCTALTTSADLYDPAAGQFASTSGAMGTARMATATAALADDHVLVAGGLTSAAGTTPTKTAELFDPQSGGTFTPTLGTMQSPRSGASATLLANGKVLIAGGWSGTQVLSNAEIYDPAKGTFSLTAGNLNYARSGHEAVLLDNGMVLIGPDGTELFCP
jgi:cysteine-rich repeat protein